MSIAIYQCHWLGRRLNHIEFLQALFGLRTIYVSRRNRRSPRRTKTSYLLVDFLMFQESSRNRVQPSLKIVLVKATAMAGNDSMVRR